MPTLQFIHGSIVDLRRHTNVHLYQGRRPFGPTDRYELWIKLRNRRRGATYEPIRADAAMSIRFGGQVRRASRDRFRWMLLIKRDPGDIVSFAQLQTLMQRHRAKVQVVSHEAEFLRWLMDREWNRLVPGSGYPELL